MKRKSLRVSEVCAISGFARKSKNVWSSVARARPKAIGFLLLLALLFCVPVAVFSALTITVTILNSGRISLASTIFIGQFSNGTYYATNLENGQTYATDAYYASKLINDAITDANAQSGGGTVQIGSGSFCLNETLVPKSNVYINASYGAILYQNHPATFGDSISLMFTDKVTDNFTLNGGIWDGNKTTLSDHRGSGTWNSNFGRYFGVGLYYSGSTNVKVMNAVIRNVIGFGLSLGRIYNGYVYNCTATNCGDNPITVEGSDENYNTLVEYCTVIGGQDVGINTFHANNVTIRYNTVSNVTQYSGASHWGIAAENSAFVNIIGNVVSGCAQNIVSTSDDVLIAQNTVTGGNPGIEIQSVSRNIVRDNIITSSAPLGTYAAQQTFDAQFINNTCSGSNRISGTGTIINGGSMFSTGSDGSISLRSAVNMRILNVKFTGSSGVLDYGETSNGVVIMGNDFSALTGTKVSLTNCLNVTIINNIGYP